jgi:adenosylcobinamide amidohydrolase
MMTVARKLIEPLALLPGIVIEQQPAHIHFVFDQLRPVLSSAVLNGGQIDARRIVNFRVDGDSQYLPNETPQQTLQNYCLGQQWPGVAVGMMTAASMSSLRLLSYHEQGVDLAVAVTTGVENARAAGDHAEWRQMTDQPTALGTINTVVMTSATMTEAAMVEAVIIATEAKTAALRELAICSPISGQIATGTGTDAIAVVGGFGPPVSACGKHTVFGELLAKAVIATVIDSINYDG